MWPKPGCGNTQSSSSAAAVKESSVARSGISMSARTLECRPSQAMTSGARIGPDGGHHADDALLVAHEVGHALAEAQLDARPLQRLLAQDVDEIVVIDGEAVRPRSRDLARRAGASPAGPALARTAKPLTSAPPTSCSGARKPRSSRTSTPCGWISSPLKRGLRPARASRTSDAARRPSRQRRRHGAAGQPAADDDDVIQAGAIRSEKPTSGGKYNAGLQRASDEG